MSSFECFSAKLSNIVCVYNDLYNDPLSDPAGHNVNKSSPDS